MIESIAANSRRSGSTTWLLNAALENPECVFIFRTSDEARKVEQLFIRFRAVNKLWRLKQWYRKHFNKKEYVPKPKFAIWPKFLSVERASNVVFDVPVIFDNSCFR